MKNWKYVMDKLVSHADLNQYFLGSLILYKEKPSKVMAISEAKVFKILDLETQKTSLVENPFGYITPPNRRVGMINIMGSVFYMKRVPMRRYQMGININNTYTSFVRGCLSQDYDQAQRKLNDFSCREIADAMFNRYPSLKECLSHNREFGGGMAFDKQFAVGAERDIYYKLQKVGTIPEKFTAVSRIVFNSGWEYLAVLLDGNHEKDLRTVATSCPKS